jgi:hypothetical protein
MKIMRLKWRGSSTAIHAVGIVLILCSITFAQIRIGGVTITLPDKTRKSGKTVAKDESVRPQPAPPAARGPVRTASSDAWVDIMLDELKKKQAEVEAFDPASPNRAFDLFTPYWIPVAVSRTARKEYFKRNGGPKSAEREAALTPALDALAAAAAKKLPLFKPNPSVFANRNPAGEQMAVRGLKNAATLRVHKIGFEEANWLIEKNALGIPLNRYKHGYIWARDGGDDHPYCHLYIIYLQQDYAGGGRYGQSFTKIRDDQIVGCP